MTPPARRAAGGSNHRHGLAHDPRWYQRAVFYEAHVRAFHDSNGDGIGDFPGFAERLDHLQELGVTALWLLPFYPSPLRDDGYDIADYTDVHPSYGTLADFKHFLRAAHDRGLRVVTELVLNHTSDQHPWFQRARRAPKGSPERSWYVWSDTPNAYAGARIIFKDFEPSNWTWDPVAGQYYWHRFYAHQPDLNFENPAVQQAMLQVVDFWLDLGVDGLRLDAVPYLFEQEGTNCENLPASHEFLRRLRRHVDERYGDRMLLAEANQWPEDAIAYFGKGDECHAAFHFPLMPRLFMSIRTEDRFPIVDILEQTPALPEGAQWLTFLRNHDELTLEMVTDEERDYLWRMYARDPTARLNLGIRRRLAPLLGNDRRRIELMTGLLFSLPGAPVVYYGDEIGMGDNVYLGDRNGVRTPMQWSGDRNAGFSRANPQRLYLPAIIDPEYHYEAVNVEAQRANPNSLLRWTQRLIALRKRHRAFGAGTLKFLYPENRKVLAFVREAEGERVLVVANLSRFAQWVELDLGAWKGMRPRELFGQTRFPDIQGAYALTLAPHAFHWFALDAVAAHEAPPEAPIVAWSGRTEREELEVAGRAAVEAALPTMLPRMRWFRGKARGPRAMELAHDLVLQDGSHSFHLSFVKVDYAEQEEPEMYLVPWLVSVPRDPGEVKPSFVLARLRDPGGREAVVTDATARPEFGRLLLRDIAKRRKRRGDGVGLSAFVERTFPVATLDGAPDPAPVRADQTNSSIAFGEQFYLKLFRVVEEGENPDLEMVRYLTGQGFPHVPPLVGWLQVDLPGRASATLGIAQVYVRNEGEAWRFTLDHLGRFYERALGVGVPAEQVPVPRGPLLALADAPPPPQVVEMIGAYAAAAPLLGQRTAEMHLALAKGTAGFAPEPVDWMYQRSLFQSLRSQNALTFPLLRRELPRLPPDVRADAERVLAAEAIVLERYRGLLGGPLSALRLRVHGDFHLGQVLWTGRDFVILDFEGEPARALSERRLKRTAFRDVAGMLRSFHYAAHRALADLVRGGTATPERMPALRAWASFWTRWVSAMFLRAYLETTASTPLGPASRADMARLLEPLLLEKAVYEIRYELNNRPAWVHIPLLGVLDLLEAGPANPTAGTGTAPSPLGREVSAS